MHDGNSTHGTFTYLSVSSDIGANTEDEATMVASVAKIVSAYVGRNEIPPSDVPALIQTVHRSLAALRGGAAPAGSLQPAVSVRKSIGHDYIVCLEDGRKFKSLKRHLRAAYSMTPEQYREKWGLPSDYPMVAPGYAKRRSELAKNMGLGQARARTQSKSPP